MIIYLPNELIDKCQLNSTNPKRIDLFENLALTRRDGKHFLIGDRDVFNYLSKLIGLSDLAKSIYGRVYKRFPLESTILSEESCKFIIGTIDSIEQGAISFNIDSLLDDSFCHYNNLLLENTVDTFVYEKAIEYYKHKKEFLSIDYYWDLRNGGGTTSFAEFGRLNKLKNVYTFAILDSDKICPNSALGSTASQFVDYHSFFGDYKIIEAHELENILPREIYSDYIRSKNDSKLTENLSIIDLDSDIFRYIDIKKGLKKYTIANSEQETKDFYITSLNITEADLVCNCESKNSCNCFVFNPMARNIYALIKKFIEERNLNVLLYITGFLEDLYLELGSKLFWIFCKSNRISMN
jgi:hypothetical protein